MCSCVCVQDPIRQYKIGKVGSITPRPGQEDGSAEWKEREAVDGHEFVTASGEHYLYSFKHPLVSYKKIVLVDNFYYYYPSSMTCSIVSVEAHRYCKRYKETV